MSYFYIYRAQSPLLQKTETNRYLYKVEKTTTIKQEFFPCSDWAESSQR